MSIPKTLHYVWVGDKKNLPERDAKFIEGWKKLHPDWKIRCWSEKDVDLKRFPLIQKALDEKRWALAADIIRMYAIYEEGGIYLDTDMELLKPLDFLTKYDAFACWESQFWFTTAVFGAKKHSPWIGKILKRYELADPTQKITTNTFLKTVHSPSVYAKDFYGLVLDGKTRVYGSTCKDDAVDSMADGKQESCANCATTDEFATFSSDYFCPKHYMTGKLRKTKNTVAIHHYASTWHTFSEKIKNSLSRTAYKVLGAKKYAFFEKRFNVSLEKKIRKELP